MLQVLPSFSYHLLVFRCLLVYNTCSSVAYLIYPFLTSSLQLAISQPMAFPRPGLPCHFPYAQKQCNRALLYWRSGLEVCTNRVSADVWQLVTRRYKFDEQGEQCGNLPLFGNRTEERRDAGKVETSWWRTGSNLMRLPNGLIQKIKLSLRAVKHRILWITRKHHRLEREVHLLEEVRHDVDYCFLLYVCHLGRSYSQSSSLEVYVRSRCWPQVTLSEEML